MIMADAKKCDRCGKYYTEREQRYVVNGFYVGCVEILSINGNCIDKYDLCDDCIKKLMRYLNHEEI